MEQWVDEMDKIRKMPVYEKKLRNALANSNVEMTIKKNLNLTGGK